jgi:predicted Zn-ribbon and HTH transcriptional regulator
MSMDRDLVCRSCGTWFAFTAGEQAFYLRKGLVNAPSRCPACRASSRPHEGGPDASHQATTSGHELAALQLFAARCARCGQDTQVSARLALGDGPISCSECSASSVGNEPALAGGWLETW